MKWREDVVCVWKWKCSGGDGHGHGGLGGFLGECEDGGNGEGIEVGEGKWAALKVLCLRFWGRVEENVVMHHVLQSSLSPACPLFLLPLGPSFGAYDVNLLFWTEK